jgi:hypothetical protein
VGQWGLRRSGLRLLAKYWWQSWQRDLKLHVEACPPCELQRLGKRERRQAKLRNYHASRRFEIVAVDVVEISPTAGDGAKKSLVIFDQCTRFVVVVPIEDESAATVARACCSIGVCSSVHRSVYCRTKGRTSAARLSDICVRQQASGRYSQRRGNRRRMTRPFYIWRLPNDAEFN